MRSIRARVTAGATLFVAVILIVAAVIAVPVLGRVLTDSVAESVDQDLDSLESQLEAAPDRAEAVVAGIDDDLLVRLQTRDGTEVVNDGDAAELAGTDGEDATTVTVDDESWLAATEDTDAGTLTVARPMEHVDDTVSATTVLLVVAVPLMVVLVGLVVWVVTGRALRPVERLRRQVDRIGASDLSRRVDAGDDELGALAATMNRMLGRLEQSQAVQRRFVSDASHELRSPLATMRQYAELAVAHPEAVSTGELGEVVVAEGERMQDLVEGLLLLARLDEGQRPPTAPVDLDDLVLRDADRLRRSGGGTGAVVEVDTSGVGPGRVEGNDRLLARVVRNLVDNAARHAEGRITLRGAVNRPSGVSGCSSLSRTTVRVCRRRTGRGSSTASPDWMRGVPGMPVAVDWGWPSSGTWWRRTAARCRSVPVTVQARCSPWTFRRIRANRLKSRSIAASFGEVIVRVDRRPREQHRAARQVDRPDHRRAGHRREPGRDHRLERRPLCDATGRRTPVPSAAAGRPPG